MKILIASMPATGHMNPMLAIARILMTEDHEVAIYTGSAFRARVEAAGAKFFCLPPRPCENAVFWDAVPERLGKRGGVCRRFRFSYEESLRRP